MSKVTELKDKFVEIYTENIKRPGSEKLLNYLLSESSDFFVAPASTRYHGAYEGGLCEHSIHVYECLKSYLERERVKEDYNMEYSDESIAIVSLLHDICKVNLYRVSYRNAKNEKSVYIVSSYMRLTREEAMAIRWHMGFSGEENKNSIGLALEMYPLALATHIADMESTFYIEGGKA